MWKRNSGSSLKRGCAASPSPAPARRRRRRRRPPPPTGGRRARERRRARRRRGGADRVRGDDGGGADGERPRHCPRPRAPTGAPSLYRSKASKPLALACLVYPSTAASRAHCRAQSPTPWRRRGATAPRARVRRPSRTRRRGAPRRRSPPSPAATAAPAVRRANSSGGPGVAHAAQLVRPSTASAPGPGRRRQPAVVRASREGRSRRPRRRRWGRSFVARLAAAVGCRRPMTTSRSAPPRGLVAAALVAPGRR